MPKLSLYWPRDLAGYRIKAPSARAPKTKAAKTIAAGERGAGWIVRNGGQLDFSVDRMQLAGLYQRLAACPPTPEGALDFVSKYGFLRWDDREPVDFICGQIEVVRSLLARKQSRDWESLRRWLIDSAKAIRIRPELLGGDPPELFFRPASLMDAIYLQFFEDLSTGAHIRLCKRPGCGNWFKYGAGTSHRNTAQYCSPKCQKADAYAKSKGAKS